MSADDVCKHQNLNEEVLEITNSNEIKEHLVEHGNNDERKMQAKLSLTTFEEDSESRREHMRR